MYPQHLKIHLLNLAIGDADYNLGAVAATAAGGAERHNTRQLTTLCMQDIWPDRLCVCVCVRPMTVGHRQRTGSTGLTHPVPTRERNVVNALCDLYVVYRPRRTLKRRELLERCLTLTVSLLKSRFESEMRTASRRKHRLVQKRARAR